MKINLYPKKNKNHSVYLRSFKIKYFLKLLYAIEFFLEICRTAWPELLKYSWIIDKLILYNLFNQQINFYNIIHIQVIRWLYLNLNNIVTREFQQPELLTWPALNYFREGHFHDVSYLLTIMNGLFQIFKAFH